MSTNEKSIEEVKRQFKEALDKFAPLRKLEEESIILTKEQNVEYMDLVENYLLPLRLELKKAGEHEFLHSPHNQFTYII